MGGPRFCIMVECMFRKVENTKWVFTLEFVVMVEPKSLEFLNEGEIRGYDDWAEVVKWVDDLSKSDSIGIVNIVLLCPQKPKFYFHSPFVWSTFVGFQISHSLYSLFFGD